MALDPQLRRLVMELGEAITRKASDEILESLRSDSPFDTGRLRSSEVALPVLGRGNVFETAIVQQGEIAPYGVMLDSGTGIFGPKAKPITPKRAKALRFQSNGQTIFAASVKGTGKHRGWFTRWPWDFEWQQALLKASNRV